MTTCTVRRRLLRLIQGNILMKKMDPSGALGGIASWRDILLGEKADSKKLISAR